MKQAVDYTTTRTVTIKGTHVRLKHKTYNKLREFWESLENPRDYVTIDDLIYQLILFAEEKMKEAEESEEK